MSPSFILFQAHGLNLDCNSIYHLILIPVIDGVPQEPEQFFFNPEIPFSMVMIGITEDEIKSFPSYAQQWPKVQDIFSRFDMAVCSADGYSARALCNTLTRLGIQFSPIRYCNTKAICRRTLNEVSYSFDYLCYTFYHDMISPDEPVLVAKRWCDFALKGLSEVQCDSFDEFFNSAKIQPGVIAPDSFTPSICKKDYSKRVRPTFDGSTVNINEDPENPFYGMNVVFTGKMDTMSRNDARAAVVRIGGEAPDRLTKETDYLVVGVQDLRVVGEKGLSSKMKTAAKYKEKGIPIEIIDEQDFIDMLGESNIPKKYLKDKRTSPFITIDDLAHLSDEDLKKATEELEKFRREMGLE